MARLCPKRSWFASIFAKTGLFGSGERAGGRLWRGRRAQESRLSGPERLEDRIAPAVTINDIVGAQGWVQQLAGDLNTILQGNAALTNPLPGVGASIEQAYNVSQVFSGILTQAQDLITQGNYTQDQVVAYLQGLAADPNQVLQPVVPAGNPASILTNNGQTLDLTLNLHDVTSQPLSLSVLDNPAFQSLKLDFGQQFALSFSNDLTLAAHVVIEHPDNGAASFFFVPADTSFTYTPRITLSSPQIAGHLAIIDFTGSVAASLNATFNGTFQADSNPLHALSEAPGLVNLSTPASIPFSVTISATLKAGEGLPDFGYTQTFTYDLVSDSNDSTHAGPAIITVGGNDVTTSAGQQALIKEVLGGTAASLFQKLDGINGIIPPNVSEFLLGETPIYGGYTLSELTGGEAPLDLLQLVSVPPAVIDAIKDILELGVAVNDFETGGSTAQAEADKLGVQYLGENLTSDPAGFVDQVIAILQGQKINLVTWNYDLVKQYLIPAAEDPTSKYYSPQANAAFLAHQLQFVSAANAAGGQTTYAKFNLQFNTSNILNNLQSDLRQYLGDTGSQFVVDYVRNVVFQGIHVDFSLDARLAAALTLGADTSFLQGGTLGDSLFIGTGPVFDAAFDLNVSASAPIAAAVGFGLFDYHGPTPGQVVGGASQAVGDVTNGAKQLGGDISGGYQNAVGQVSQIGTNIGKQLVDARNVAESDLQQLLSAAGSVSISLATNGQFMVGVCDPSGANNGKLTFTTIANSSSPSDFLATAGGLSASLSGDATVLGVHGHLGINAPGIISFQAGCVIPTGTNGPGAATQPGPTAAPASPPFAELNRQTLQVYGSANSDNIDVMPVGDQLIVSRSGQSLSFALSSISSIRIDLRGNILARVSAGPPPADGGTDAVTVDGSVPATIPVDIYGGSGNDTFQVGDGNDLISLESGNNTVFAGNGADTIVESDPGASSGANMITLGSGNDNVTLRNGNNTVIGGGGNDVFTVGSGDNTLTAGDGASVTMTGGGGSNIFNGGAGADRLDGTLDTNDVFFGGSGNQTVMYGGTGDNYFFAGTGSESMFGGMGTNIFFWQDGDGNITVDGGGGNSILMAGGADSGNDFQLTATGSHAILSRTIPTPRTLDTQRVQTVIIAPGAGANTLTIGDLTGTAVAGVIIDYSSHTATDKAILFGRTTADSVLATITLSLLDITGLAAEVHVKGSTPSDQLTINGNGGNDLLMVDSSALTAASVKLVGGTGINTLEAGDLGGGGPVNPAGSVTLVGGSESDAFIIRNPSGAVFAPVPGISIQGNGTSGEQLWLTGGGGATFTETDQAGADSTSGSLATTNTTLKQTVVFTGLGLIADAVALSALRVITPPGSNFVSVLDGTFPANFPSPIPQTGTIVTAATFTPILIANKQSLTVDGTTGHNTFFVNNPHAAPSLTALSVHGGNLGDIFDVRATDIPVSTTLFGGNGNDGFDVGSPLVNLAGIVGDAGDLDYVKGHVTVIGNGGSDSLEVDDHGATGAFNYIVTPTAVTNDSATQPTIPTPTTPPARTFAGISYDSTGSPAADTITSLRLDGTDQVNIFSVSPSKTTAFTINGNLPASGTCIPGGGDYLKLDTTHLANGTGGRKLHITSTGNGFWSFTDGTKNLNFLSIERFNHVAITATVVPPGPSSMPVVTVRDAETGEIKFQVQVYESTFHGGVNVAVGDVNCDGIPDLIVTPGPGRAPLVKIYNGTPDANGNYPASLLTSFYAFPTTFLGGVTVAVGDVNFDGANDVVVGAEAGWLPQIRVYNGMTLQAKGGPSMIGSPFNAFENTFRGGVTLAVADLNNDGYADIIAGRASLGQSTVSVFSGKTLGLMKTFTAFSPSFLGGITLAAGDYNGDGVNDIIVGAAAGWLPEVAVYSGTNVFTSKPVTPLTTYLAAPATSRQGVIVTAVPINGGNPGFVEQTRIVTELGTLDGVDFFTAEVGITAESPIRQLAAAPVRGVR